MWRWVKVPKAIALVAFFLPWVTVSCSSSVLMSASGWSLATGHFNVTNPLTGVAEPQQGEPNYWLTLALVAIVAGLAVSFWRRRVAAVVLVTAIAALALVIGGTHRFSNRVLHEEAARHRTGTQIDKVAERIHVDRQIGYWLELAALAAAAVMAGLTLAGRDRAGAGGRTDSDAAPFR